MKRYLIAGLATLVTLPLGAAQCDDTAAVGGCNGAVHLAVSHGREAGLVVAVWHVRCEGSVNEFRLNTKLYHDGILVYDDFFITVPDSSGYSVRRTVICTTGTYRAHIRITAAGPNGQEHHSDGYKTLRIRRQSQCRD